MNASKPKLVIYLPTLASGGAERLHLHLAPAFVAMGYDVTFLLQHEQGAWMSHVPAGVRVVSLKASRTLQSFWPLVQFLKREEPDILVANLGHNNIMALWAAAIAGVKTKIVTSQHSVLSAETVGKTSWQHRVLPLLYQLFLGWSDGIVAVSSGVADDLAQRAKLRREHITVIYNPVVFPDFGARMMEPVDHPWVNDPTPYILAVGRLVPTKDFETLLRAFAQAVKQKDLRLIILGEGPLHQELMALAQQLAVGERVSMPGFVKNPLPFMHKASMLVMSSQYEGFGNVLVEALACGTPVVSTDCPYGPAEILANGTFGKLVPVGDVAAMVQAILEVFGQRPDTESLQRRGREFTVQRAADHYGQLFQSLLG